MDTIHVCSICGEPISPGFTYWQFPLPPGEETTVCENCVDEFMEDYAHVEDEE